MRTRRHIAVLCLAAGLMACLPGPAAAIELNPVEVAELERLLARLNFDPGEIDSVADERTRTAIRLYQEFAALTPDGEPTAALLAELRAVVQAFQEMKAVKAEQERQDEEQAAKAAKKARAAEQAAAEEAQAAERERLAREKAAREAEEARAAEQAAQAAAEAAKAAEEAQAAEQAAQAAERERLAAAEAAKAAEEAQAAERERLAAEQAAKAAKQAARAQPAPAPAGLPPKPKARPGFDLDGMISRMTGGERKEEPAPEPAPPPPPKKNEDEQSSLGNSRGDSGGNRGLKLKLPPAVQSAARIPARLAPGGDGYATFKSGYAAARSGKLDLAIELYTRAIDTGDLKLEHLAGAFYNRANAHHYLGALKFAIQDYSAAILNKPDFPGAYYNRGFAFQANGQRTRALADFMKARMLGLQRLGVRSPDLSPPLP